VIDPHIATQSVVLAAILGAITWDLVTWRYGIPSSSSHALVGGVMGAGLVRAGTSGVQWHEIYVKVIVPLLASPLIGFVFGFGLMTIIAVLFASLPTGSESRKSSDIAAASLFGLAALVIIALTSPGSSFLGHSLGAFLTHNLGGLAWIIPFAFIGLGVAMVKSGRAFRSMQLVSAATMAYAHGTSDAQKSMGIITLALVAGKYLAKPDVPTWVMLVCAVAMGFGTAAGGWRIIKTMGHRIIRLEPANGFAAETSAAAVILTAAHFGMPVSTTHCIAGSIFGVGASKRINAVRWQVAINMVTAWVITIPASALVAGIAYVLLREIQP
jgi:PiT family inorganic phosphate transporter